MLRRKYLMALVVFAAAFTMGAAARAVSIPAVTLDAFTDGNGTQNYYSAGSSGTDYSAGWKFTVTSPLTLTHLGVLDWGNITVDASGNGLDVAIYSMDGSTTYASTTVVDTDTTTSPGGVDGRPLHVTSDFRYHELPSPVTLGAGEYLIISETVQGSTVGNGFGTFVFNPFATTAAGLNYDRQWVLGGVSSSAWYPDPGADSTRGYWGGSFLIFVPEPASAALLGLGTLLVMRRRKA